MTPRISIIVLTYNGIDLTIDCLESILLQDYPGLEIIIVDNGSIDKTPEIIRREYPLVKVIENRSNLGYAEGNNIGINFALRNNSDFIFLLNNDTILDPGCASSLAKFMENNPDVGVVGPMIYMDANKRMISSAGGEVDWKKATALNVGVGEIDTGQYQSRSVDFVNGCGIFVRKESIQEAGLLDKSYFMYWEETDWCFRIKKKGFSIYFWPSATMIHKAPILSSDLSPTTLYYMTRNRFLFFSRHAPARIKALSLSKALHGSIRGVLENRNSGRMNHSKAMSWAIVHAITGKWGFCNPDLWN